MTINDLEYPRDVYGNPGYKQNLTQRGGPGNRSSQPL